MALENLQFRTESFPIYFVLLLRHLPQDVQQLLILVLQLVYVAEGDQVWIDERDGVVFVASGWRRVLVGDAVAAQHLHFFEQAAHLGA